MHLSFLGVFSTYAKTLIIYINYYYISKNIISYENLHMWSAYSIAKMLMHSLIFLIFVCSSRIPSMICNYTMTSSLQLYDCWLQRTNAMVDLSLVATCQHPQRRQQKICYQAHSRKVELRVIIWRITCRHCLPGQDMKHPHTRQKNWKITSSVPLWSLMGWILWGNLAPVRNLQKRMPLVRLYCGWVVRALLFLQILTTCLCF